MVAHSQFCWSGDHTVEALQLAVQRMEEADKSMYADRYTFLVSDANLRRYGIHPEELAKYMDFEAGTKGTDGIAVRTFAIFLASIGDEADRIKSALPRGRAFTCFDTTALPGLFRSIFTAEFADDNF